MRGAPLPAMIGPAPLEEPPARLAGGGGTFFSGLLVVYSVYNKG